MSSDHEVDRLKQVYQNYQDASHLNMWSVENPGNQYIVIERMRHLHTLLMQHRLLPLTEKRVLDIGCGSGKVLASLLDWGATPKDLYGIDLLPERIQVAQTNYPDFHFQAGNAEQLPFENASFDLIMFFTVFSSILDPSMAHNVADVANRLLKQGGAIIWYDFRYQNPNNQNTHPMTRQKIHKLFPGYHLELRTVTLLPMVARRLSPFTSTLYPLLSNIPFLRTHYIGLLIKPT